MAVVVIDEHFDGISVTFLSFVWLTIIWIDWQQNFICKMGLVRCLGREYGWIQVLHPQLKVDHTTWTTRVACFGFWLLYHHCNSPTESPWCFDVDPCWFKSCLRHSEACGHFWSVCASECSIYGWRLAAMSQPCCLRPGAMTPTLIFKYPKWWKRHDRRIVKTVEVEISRCIEFGFFILLFSLAEFSEILQVSPGRHWQISWPKKLRCKGSPAVGTKKPCKSSWIGLAPFSPSVSQSLR